MKMYSTSHIETANSTKRKNFSLFKKYVNKYFIDPLCAGFFGFAIFFSVLIITKFLSFSFGVQKDFVVDFNDVVLSFIGFILLAIVKLLENIVPKINK